MNKMELSEWEALTGNNVLLYLKLLLSPDYAYGIATSFARMQENMKEETIPKTLSDASYVAARLTKMAANGIIIRSESEAHRRAYYDINPTIFNCIGLTSDVAPGQSTHLLNQIRDSIDTNMIDSMMQQILKLKKLDSFTISLYFYDIIISKDVGNYEIMFVDGTKPDHYMEGISRYVFCALKAERFPPDWNTI